MKCEYKWQREEFLILQRHIQVIQSRAGYFRRDGLDLYRVVSGIPGGNIESGFVEDFPGRIRHLYGQPVVSPIPFFIE